MVSNKKPKLEIKKIKKGKDFVVVAKLGNKIISSRKWDKKDFTVNEAKRRFNHSRTFFKTKDIDRQELTNVVEYSNFTKGARGRGNKQIVIEATLKDGTKIISRSATIGSRRAKSRKQALKNAEEGFWERVSQHFGGEYDAKAGKKFAEKINIKTKRQGVVYYVQKKNSKSD